MAASIPGDADGARELALVGKVEMRIALAETDSKLASILGTYLAPLLLKLTSPHVAVRNKVIAVCQHINRRVQDPTIPLPVTALLAQLKESPNALVKHFDTLYIQQGFERLPAAERRALIPVLLKGLRRDYDASAKSAASLFNVFLKLLHHLELPARGEKDDEHLRETVGLQDRADAEFVASWLGKLILFAPTAGSTAPQRPGLSADDYDFLQMHGKPETWRPEKPGGLGLTETKVRAVKFLTSGAFTDGERFLPALFASADTNFRVSEVGDDMLGRSAHAVSLEEPAMVERLFELYLGRPVSETPPVRPALQLKILGTLCKSRLAASYATEIRTIVQRSTHASPDAADPAAGTATPGLGASKLRQQVFALVNWATRMAPKERLAHLAPNLIHDLQLFVDAQTPPGAPARSFARGAAERAARAAAYENIGLLAKGAPAGPDAGQVAWLLTVLTRDDAGVEVSLSIEQALGSALAGMAAHGERHDEDRLTEVLEHFMGLQPGTKDTKGFTVVRSARYICVRFANRCLPFHNVRARRIDLLALAEGAKERSEVLEEGRKGLDPYWYRNLNPIDNFMMDGEALQAAQRARYDLPQFGELVDRVCTRSIDLGDGRPAAVEFCASVLFARALESCSKAPAIDVDWNRNLDALIANDGEARSGVKAFLSRFEASRGDQGQALDKLFEAAFTGLYSQSLSDCARVGKLLLTLLPLSPPQVWIRDVTHASYVGDLFLSDDDSNILSSTDHSLRGISSHLFGLLAGHFDASRIQASVEHHLQRAKSWQTAVGSTVPKVHGSVLTLAYFVSRSVSKSMPEHADLGRKYLAPCISVALDILSSSRDKDLLEAAVTAADQLSLFGLLRPTQGDGGQDSDTSTNSQNSAFLAGDRLSTFLGKLEELAKSGDERAVSTLGHFGMQCPEDGECSKELSRILDMLYALHEKRQPELQFAVGSALSCVAAGWSSKALVGVNDIDADLVCPPRHQTLGDMLDKILDDCKQTKPALRAAAVIWLLSIVQYCGHMEAVQQRLRLCQQAFKGFLADREPLNQEAASRGLTLVYETGDASIREDLVRDLVGSFTNTRSTLAGRVDQETQLFEPGALPTGEGASVTTYKDIVNLAGEVGDPSLVYRFMSLASNSSIWSTRAAFGRFGLSRILADASDGGDGPLARNPKLYPVLFRYRFDPNSNVRAAMNDIWTAIVKDPGPAVTAHFDQILDDLLTNIVVKEWRTRQACCAAIADLIQGQPLAQYESRLTEIWTMAFKVADDIKDSVRVAAMSLAKNLTGILIRSLEAGEGASAKANAMLEQVLPFLLGPSGLEASAKDVQVFAVATLLDVIKKASARALRPFLASLVSHLTMLLSSIEPEAVNYLRLNADKYGMTESQIDDARLSSVRGSPMIEAIERCLDMLDEASMRELAPALTTAIKSALGLPSKVGASRTVVSLTTRRSVLFKPYADSFLQLLRGQVLDRNDTVSAAAATACGYLARSASQDAVLQLVGYAQRLFVEAADERARVTAGELTAAAAKHATDRFAAIGSAALPFTYLGMHDEHEEARALFASAWEESVGGSRAVLLYLREILELAGRHLASPRWSIKHAGALTIADTVRAAGTGAAISSDNARLIWPALAQAMSGKTWDGKEKVLQAVVMLAKNSPLETNSGMADEMQVSTGV